MTAFDTLPFLLLIDGAFGLWQRACAKGGMMPRYIFDQKTGALSLEFQVTEHDIKLPPMTLVALDVEIIEMMVPQLRATARYDHIPFPHGTEFQSSSDQGTITARLPHGQPVIVQWNVRQEDASRELGRLQEQGLVCQWSVIIEPSAQEAFYAEPFVRIGAETELRTEHVTQLLQLASMPGRVKVCTFLEPVLSYVPKTLPLQVRVAFAVSDTPRYGFASSVRQARQELVRALTGSPGKNFMIPIGVPTADHQA